MSINNTAECGSCGNTIAEAISARYIQKAVANSEYAGAENRLQMLIMSEKSR